MESTQNKHPQDTQYTEVRQNGNVRNDRPSIG